MVDFAGIRDFVLNSTETFIIVLIIIAGTVLAAKIIDIFLKRSVQRSSKLLKVDPTKYNFVRHVLTATLYLVGLGFAVYMIPSFRTLAISLFAGAGILAVVVGFASQQAFANMVSGILIIIFKPFKVGERIKIGENAGMVEDITLRHTVIRNFENKRLIIPNQVISNETIENWDSHDTKICRWFEVGISYDADIDKAMKIIQQEAEKHPNFLDNRTKEEKDNGEPAVPVRVVGFGDSAVNLRAWIWAKDSPAAFVLGCDLNKKVKERFDNEGIEIPFPYRTVVYKKDIEKDAKKRGTVKKSAKKRRKKR